MGAICGIDWASEWHDVHIADEQGALLAAEQFSSRRARRERADRAAARSTRGVLRDRAPRRAVGRTTAGGRDRRCSRSTPTRSRRRVIASARRRARTTASTRLCCASWLEPIVTASRCLRPAGDETLALKTLVRTREDLVEARVALANQLRAQLQAFWPGAERVFADVDSSIGLAFLERYPSPADARSLGEKRLEGFLARHRYCGRRTPAELLEKLRSAAQRHRRRARGRCAAQRRDRLVAALRPIVEQIGQLTSQIAGAIESPSRRSYLPRLLSRPQERRDRRRAARRDRR